MAKSKLVFFGVPQSGKSSLISRMLGEGFQEKYSPTADVELKDGVDSYFYEVGNRYDGINNRFVGDTLNDEINQAIAFGSEPEAQKDRTLVFTLDCTQDLAKQLAYLRETIEKAKIHFPEAKCIFVVTKTDASKKLFTIEEAQIAAARELGIKSSFVACSAKKDEDLSQRIKSAIPDAVDVSSLNKHAQVEEKDELQARATNFPKKVAHEDKGTPRERFLKAHQILNEYLIEDKNSSNDPGELLFKAQRKLLVQAAKEFCKQASLAFENQHKPLSDSEMDLLTEALENILYFSKGLDDSYIPNEVNKILFAGKIEKLGQIANDLNKKSALKQAGGALMIFGGVALIVAGIALAIPSGGSSLLATLLGAKTLAVGGATAVMAGTGDAIIGAASFYMGKKINQKNIRQGLEKNQNLIKAAIQLHQRAEALHQGLNKQRPEISRERILKALEAKKRLK